MNTIQFIDSHSHLYAEEFDDDLDLVVARAQEVGVSQVLLPNIDLDSVDRMMNTYLKYPDFFKVMMGLHPTSVKSDFKQELDLIYEKIQTSPSTYIGIGEVGLDFYWDKTFMDEQYQALRIQLHWAKEMNLPVVIHCRDAYPELAALLLEKDFQSLKGVIHSFSGSLTDFEKYLPMENWYIGINGIVTFKNSNLPEIIKKIPQERLIIETDSPYLAPVPFRGRRNESAYLFHTLKKIADIYGESVENIAYITKRNTEKLFLLKNLAD